MAADTDICNLALGFLGDVANVDSISPPDPSYQAEQCAKFYPMARDMMLDGHNWGFATRRILPASIAVSPAATGMWAYAYIAPTDCLTVQRVYDPNQPADLVANMPQPYAAAAYAAGPGQLGVTGADIGYFVPQPFSIESDLNGNYIIYTNQANAAIAYTGRVTDPTKWPPTFVVALAYLLASFLAGPILKGTEGAKMSLAMAKAYQTSWGIATTNDANERRTLMPSTTPWMANR